MNPQETGYYYQDQNNPFLNNEKDSFYQPSQYSLPNFLEYSKFYPKSKNNGYNQEYDYLRDILNGSVNMKTMPLKSNFNNITYLPYRNNGFGR